VISSRAPQLPGIPENDPSVYFVIMGEGNLTVAELFKFEGKFRFGFEANASEVVLRIDIGASLNLGPLGSLSVNASAQVNIGTHDPGFALYFSIEASDLVIDPIFTIDGTFKIMLNTRQDHDFTAINGEVVERQSFEIALEDMTLNVLGGAIKFEGSGYIRISGGHFRIQITNLEFDFFGLATIQASGYFQDDGQFRIQLSGALNLGIAGTGIFGTIDVLVYRENTVGFPDPVLFVSGTVSGKVKLFGITLAGVTVGIEFDGFSGKLSATVIVELLFWVVEKTFTIG
jgi:hypothetical protein